MVPNVHIRVPIVFCISEPHIRTSSGFVRELPKKSGDVPQSPFLTVAALVPSAGAIRLQIELR